MRSSAVFCVTVALAIGLITTSAWAAPDDATADTATSDEPAATPYDDPENPDMTAAAPHAPPVPADSDCLIVFRYTHLSDAEQDIDPDVSVTWIATDAERETSEKCRAIGAR
jgi:hypothetical protein